MLAPTLSLDYLLTFDNFSLHVIVPLLAIADFFIFDKDIKLTKINCLFGIAMPLYYLIFVFIGLPLGFTYGPGLKFPYFFLDFESNGCFTIGNSLGVFYWILILIAAICGLCYLFYLFMKLRQKKKS